MPRKDNAIKKTVKQVYYRGRTAAQAGRALASQEKLMKRNGYTTEEAREYTRGYKDYQSTPEIQKMRKARKLALNAIYKGNICANKNEVLKKYPNFSEDEIKVYLKVIAEQNPSKETLVQNKARQDARLAARRGTHKGVAETAKNTKTRVFLTSYDEVVRRKGDREAVAIEGLVLLSKEHTSVRAQR
jgi:hypothetical protein